MWGHQGKCQHCTLIRSVAHLLYTTYWIVKSLSLVLFSIENYHLHHFTWYRQISQKAKLKCHYNIIFAIIKVMNEYTSSISSQPPPEIVSKWVYLNCVFLYMMGTNSPLTFKNCLRSFCVPTKVAMIALKKGDFKYHFIDCLTRNSCI